MALVRQKGYKLENIDSTICLQKPKIKALVPEMQSVIANCLEVEMIKYQLRLQQQND